MQQELLQKFQTLISQDTNSHATPNNLKTLTLARTLLTNPTTSLPTLHSILQTLTLDRHVIKILSDAASVHPSVATTVIQAVRPILNGQDRAATYALALVESLKDYSVLSEDVVLSLVSSEFVSVRMKIIDVLVKNVNVLRGEVMMGVFFRGFSDIFPNARRKAMDGVVELFKRDGEWIDGVIVRSCYDFVVGSLRDEDESMRLATLGLVSECARLFAEVGGGNEMMDLIFVQLCWMARDMSLKVRLGAVIALGKVRLVSEGVLLQSLSKKIIRSKDGRSSLIECIITESKFPLSGAAGAFVHGIEDEHHEVRTAAVKSLGMLSKFSIQFADDALNLLMDMLNDDVTAVQLQTLQTLLHMAKDDSLAIQEKHIHMFLGLLADFNAVIRQEARKVLQLMKLPKSEMFTSSVDSLITNLMMHPEEEDDICRVLFYIGKRHGKFTTTIVKEFEIKIVPYSKGELNLDSPQAAALLVLAISITFSSEQFIYKISPAILSFAIPLFGRISRSLRDVIHHDLLLAHLSNCSGLPFPATILQSKDVEMSPNVVEEKISYLGKCTNLVCSSSCPVNSETSEINSKGILFDSREILTLHEQSKQEGIFFSEEIIQSVNLIIKTVAETWQLIKSSHLSKAQRILSACKGELEMITWSADGSNYSLLAFAFCYVQVVQLISSIWEPFQSNNVVGITVLDILFEKLDTCLKQLRYRFSGFSREEEYHILELILLCYVLRRACKVGIFSRHILNKLQAIIHRIDCLSEGQLKLSSFYEELKKSSIERNMNEVQKPLPARKLLQLFCFEQISFSFKLKHIKAELSSTGNDSENPLLFISGMPVGIAFNLTLYNISSKIMLWLRMSIDNTVQYVFLDMCKFAYSHSTSKCTINIPFYETPKAANFLLKACVCMECPADSAVDYKKGQGGPRYEVVMLSEEIDIWFRLRENDS